MNDAATLEHPTGLILQSNEEYHSGPGISKSHLDVIAEASPLHYWHKYRNPAREPEEKTEALIIGSAIHAAILEPDLFPIQYVAATAGAPPRPTRRQIEAAKPSANTVNAIEFWRSFDVEHAGKTVLRAEDYETCLAVRDAVHRHPVAAGLLRGGRSEQSFYGIDPGTGELIKCRTDYLHDSGAMIVDLKSARSAHPEVFARDSASHRYPVAPAWYNRVFDACYGEHPPSWVWLAVEKEPPYAIGIYYVDVDDDMLERAQIAAERDFQRIVECSRSGVWPDYGHQPRPLALPSWAKL